LRELFINLLFWNCGMGIFGLINYLWLDVGIWFYLLFLILRLRDYSIGIIGVLIIANNLAKTSLFFIVILSHIQILSLTLINHLTWIFVFRINTNNIIFPKFIFIIIDLWLNYQLINILLIFFFFYLSIFILIWLIN
jgi:hypothetical protein